MITLTRSHDIDNEIDVRLVNKTLPRFLITANRSTKIIENKKCVQLGRVNFAPIKVVHNAWPKNQDFCDLTKRKTVKILSN